MLCYVLMCVIAFIVICKEVQADALNEQDMQALGSKVLQVSDFDNIVEPKSRSDFESHVRNVRGSNNKDVSFLNVESMEECPNGKCLQSEYGFTKNTGLENKEQAQFINQNYENREIRGFKVIPLLDDYGIEGEKSSEENPNEINDPDFISEQVQAENITNATKILIDEIENPNSILQGQSIINEDDQMCCEQDDTKDKNVFVNEDKLVENSKRKLTADDMLQMRAMKHLPKMSGLRTSGINEKFVQNPYHEQSKKNPIRKQPKYDYFALITDNKLVNTPIAKHRQKSGRKRSNRSLYRNPTYRKMRHRYRLESINSNTFDNDEMGNSPNIKINDKDIKRTVNKVSLNNKYLEEADALIKSVQTTLNLNSENKNSFKENDNPANAASGAHTNQDLNNNNRKAIKKEANKDSHFYYEILEKENMK